MAARKTVSFRVIKISSVERSVHKSLPIWGFWTRHEYALAGRENRAAVSQYSLSAWPTKVQESPAALTEQTSPHRDTLHPGFPFRPLQYGQLLFRQGAGVSLKAQHSPAPLRDYVSTSWDEGVPVLEGSHLSAARALRFDACSYQSLKSMLAHGLDRQSPDESPPARAPVNHANIRGAQYFDPPALLQALDLATREENRC